MNIEKINFLVAQGESHIVEFKKSTAQLRSACETACAFLNGDGGTILFGVTDNLRIIGQEISDKTKRDIGNELAKITPVSEIEVGYLNLSDTNKYIIVFHVTSDSTKRPYMYDGKAFLRNQSNTIPMPTAYINQLASINADGKLSWENQTPDGITINDLDAEQILSTVHEGTLNGRIPENFTASDPVIALQRLGLIENNKITNATMILFGKNLNYRYPQCVLKLARFRGTDKSEFIDNKQICGNIFKLLDAAIAFANTYLPIASSFSKSEFFRKDTPLFPILAIREAVANALVHRDYSYYGGSVSFAIYDDRLEIWNYGLLPSGISAQNLKDLGRSIPRNPKIANVLYYHKIFESWGRGVQMIIDECIKAGHPEPFYSQDSVGTLLTIPAKQRIGTSLTKLDTQHLSSRQQEIIAILKQYNELAKEEIGHKLNKPVSERWLRNELNTLKDMGYITYIGNTKSRKWFIK
ncbi:MAG: RNA-binding domain-containing protein [Burkholderiales bacterium]